MSGSEYQAVIIMSSAYPGTSLIDIIAWMRPLVVTGCDSNVVIMKSLAYPGISPLIDVIA